VVFCANCGDQTDSNCISFRKLLAEIVAL